MVCIRAFPLFFLIFMSCHYFSSILFFCNKMHLCFEKCLTHFVQARGALHKIAPGQNRCYSLSPFVCTVSLHRLNMGTRAFTVYCLAWRCPPQVLHQRSSNRGSGETAFLASKRGKKINHSGWAFVPICHGAAITIPFSTLFVFKLKRRDVTGNLTSSAGCLCSSITIIPQIWNDTTDALAFFFFRKMELWESLPRNKKKKKKGLAT